MEIPRDRIRHDTLGNRTLTSGRTRTRYNERIITTVESERDDELRQAGKAGTP